MGPGALDLKPILSFSYLARIGHPWSVWASVCVKATGWVPAQTGNSREAIMCVWVLGCLATPTPSPTSQSDECLNYECLGESSLNPILAADPHGGGHRDADQGGPQAARRGSADPHRKPPWTTVSV